MKRKTGWRVVFILSLIGCLCCAVALGWYVYQSYQAQQEYEKLQIELQAEAQAKEEAAKKEEEERPTLQEINTDIYAWIRIPDTKIDYPIARREGDDSFYLNYDMYQEPRFAGCIYTEDLQQQGFPGSQYRDLRT